MDARRQILEAELKTVQTLQLAPDPELVLAATERERELRAELQQAKENSSPMGNPHKNKRC